MESYNPNKVYYYTIDELVYYVISKEVAKEDLYKVWKFKKDHPKLEHALDAKDNEDWEEAEKTNTSESYQSYLKVYDNELPFYIGAHVEEAKAALAQFGSQQEQNSEQEEREDSEDLAGEKSITADSKYENAGNHSEEGGDDTVDTDPDTAYSEESETVETFEEKPKDSHVESDSVAENHSTKIDAELEENDNRDWLKATSSDTISAYSDYLKNKYSHSSNGYQGKHVEKVRPRILQIEETNVWDKAKATDTVKAYEDYIAKYGPHKNVLKTPHIEEAKQELAKIKHSRPVKFLKPLLSVVSVCIWGLIGYWIFVDLIKKANEPIPLSDAEVAAIVKEVQDSLKVELFDGFYVLPALNNPSDDIVSSIPGSNPTSRKGVINEYVSSLSTKHWNVYNKNGALMVLPESCAGIDSICLTQPPFLEYIDNNGLRRVVALFHDDVYFYLGDCGSHDGFRQYILANKNGKSGLVDINGTVLKDFFNDKIIPTPSGYTVKNGSTEQFYNFAGSKVDQSPTPKTTSTASSPSINYEIVRKYGADHYFKDKVSGKVFSYFPEITYSCEKSTYKVKGKNGVYGLYDASARKMVLPTIYKNIIGSNSKFVVLNQNGKWGLYDSSGNKILPEIYDYIDAYGSQGNIYRVKRGERYGFARDGKEIIEPKFKDVGKFSADPVLAAAKNDEGNWGYIDINGEFKIKPQYYSAGIMSPQGARVMKDPNQYGFITPAGNLIASWYYLMGTKFYADRIWVQNEEGLKGFVDRNNKLIIPYLFEGKDEPYFNELSRLAKVTYKGINWFINTNGAYCYPADGHLLPNEQDIQLQILKAEKKVQEEAEKKAKGKSEKENKKKKGI